eukprot:CAMPEP_0118943952 /NCGR_PEP_ID=MMETSP1169-20130426/39348_1 /TAXON_ID=36882 /ORGANISM="Pyramimonas obovata, Strain CCMP722" /LENGTH=59 /DNA_ID=CAMNT_0006889317 /DNA_START=277 /DNA_END=453 /DNA_ORIENTATION=-
MKWPRQRSSPRQPSLVPGPLLAASGSTAESPSSSLTNPNTSLCQQQRRAAPTIAMATPT